MIITKKFLVATLSGVIVGYVLMLALVALAENTEYHIYSTDSFQQTLMLTVVLGLATIAVEFCLNTSARECVLDLIACLITVLIFRKVVGETWLTSTTGLWTILKEFAIPLVADVLFAALASSPITKAITSGSSSS